MAAEASGQPAKQIKVGHAGTLDPNATGLLVVLVGNYTKRQAEFMKLDKIYAAEIKLGASSDTDDADGHVVEQQVTTQPKLTDIKRVLNTQLGQLEQVPPQYSAIKQAGKKAYEAARQGQRVEFKPRSVTIHSIGDLIYDWPTLEFTTHVSSGTYIRSMARDIGKALGTGAYLNELRRESIGPYKLADALSINQLSPDNLKRHLKQA
jgi:tRNA pseudouridine55 synthase